jgi:type IV secretory pathway component VirB8
VRGAQSYPEGMSVDAILIVLSVLSFVALFAIWISAPLRADAPHVVAVEAAPSSAAIAA